MCRCQRIGCTEEGTHALKVVIPSASGLRPTAAEGLLGIVMCRFHFEEAELEPDFLIHPTVQMLFSRVLDDDVAPAWEDAYLVPVMVGSPEFSAWEHSVARVH